MAQKIVNEPVNEVNVNVEETNVENEVNVSFNNVIKKLIASGCKRISNVRIKNVNYTDKDSYVMVSFSLGAPIKAFITDDGGITYEEGKTNTMFTSTFAIAGALKEDEELGWMANSILDNPQALNLVFNGSYIDILQQHVSAGEEYRNPFSTRKDIEPQIYDHDIIVNHPICFKLGRVGQKMADKWADKMLAINKDN